jgi:uncharacterized membrane protein YqhA
MSCSLLAFMLPSAQSLRTSFYFITSVDDLKNRLSKIIFLILIVRYFEFALKLSPTTITETLQFACGIVLIAVAIFVTSRK